MNKSIADRQDSRRLYKNARVASSGVYDYAIYELPALNLDDIPEQHRDRKIFGVYRSATVIERAKDLYTKQPFVHNHPDATNENPEGFVTSENFRDLALGWTGDVAVIDYLPEINEVAVKAEITIVDQEAIRAYDSGEVEVSAGYKGSFSWRDGVTPNGEEYQIVMEAITEVNHVALVPRGRGGKNVAIIDNANEPELFRLIKSKGANMKGLKTGLFHSIINAFMGVKDSSTKTFRESLGAVIKDRASLSDAEISSKISKIGEMCATLPDSEKKAKLLRFVDDLAFVKGQSDDVALKAVGMVSDAYEDLEKSAMDDMPEEVKDKTEDVPAEKVEEPAAPEVAEAGAPEAPVENTTEQVAENAPEAVVDLTTLCQKEPATWTPEEVHALMKALAVMLPKLQALAGAEAEAPVAEETNIGDDGEMNSEDQDNGSSSDKAIADHEGGVYTHTIMDSDKVESNSDPFAFMAKGKKGNKNAK